MEKVNITTNAKAQKYIALTRAFQSVQKQIALCVDGLSEEDWERPPLNEIDNEIHDIIERLCSIIGAEIIHG